MDSAKRRRRVWRFATGSRPARAMLAGCLLLIHVHVGCASARPGPTLPPLRSAAPEPAPAPATEILPGPEIRPFSAVTGDIRILGGARFDLGMAVVSLRPRDRPASTPDASGVVRVRSESRAFEPPLRVAWPRQPIELVNGGPLVHRLFTPRLPDRVFELAPGGRSERFVLVDRGPARFYCSLHAGETFLVLIEDAPWVAVLGSDGRYRFEPVPPGRYTLTLWSERVAGPIRQILVDGYSRIVEPIWLDPELIDP